MKSLKVVALFLAVIMMSTGLSACGGDKKEEKKTTTQSKPADTSKNETKEEKEAMPAESTEEPSIADKLKSILSIGYAGADNHGTTIYWATDADVSFGLLLAVSADQSQKISFVGYIQEDGTKLTITDDKTGNARTVDVQPIEMDGQAGLQMTDEDGDITALFPVPVDQVIDAMFAAEAN